MKKKNNKKHAKNASGTKKKDAPADDDPLPESAKKTAMSHVLSNGWVQNLGATFLVLLVALALAIMFRSQVKYAALSAASIGTMVLWFGALTVVRFVSEPGERELVFSSRYKNFDGDRDPDKGMFWYRYKSKCGDTISPIAAILDMTIKNPRTSPVLIETLELDVQKLGKPWTSLRPIPVGDGQTYISFGDITKASLVTMNLLNTSIVDSIQPGDTIEGWAFWALPEKYSVVEGDSLRWRTRVKDSGGEKSDFTSEFAVISTKGEPAKMGPGASFYLVPGGPQDLSNLCRRNFE
jgi:hypothetical protein